MDKASILWNWKICVRPTYQPDQIFISYNSIWLPQKTTDLQSMGLRALPQGKEACGGLGWKKTAKSSSGRRETKIWVKLRYQQQVSCL